MTGEHPVNQETFDILALGDLAGPGMRRPHWHLSCTAEACGVDVPVSRALLTLASCFNDDDYSTRGRTLANMGFSGLTPAEIMARLG